MANAVSVAIGDNGNRLVFEIWWNFFYDLHDNNRKFLHIPFANKGIDVINISNILNRKEVVKEIPPYFKNPWLRLVLVIVLKWLITLISFHPGLDKFPTPLMLSLQP
jgi:hypothetical protein